MEETFSQEDLESLPGLALCALAARSVRHCQLVVDFDAVEYYAIDKVANLAERLACGQDIGVRELLDARAALKVDLKDSANWLAADKTRCVADWAACCATFAGRATGYAVRHGMNYAVDALPQCENALREDLEKLRRLCEVRAADDDTPFPHSDVE
jgi:hypothetical protein